MPFTIEWMFDDDKRDGPWVAVSIQRGRGGGGPSGAMA
jgi:hypothetical protein